MDEFIRVNEVISRHRCVDIDVIRAYPAFPWVWNQVAMNPNMTDNIIKANPDLPWVAHTPYIRPGTTIEYVLSHPELEWSYEAVLHFIRPCDILTHPELPWTAESIHQNHNLTWDFIDAHPDGIVGIPWDYAKLGEVAGLTWKRIVELDRAGVAWDWWCICANRFGR